MKSAIELYQRIAEVCEKCNRDPSEVTLIGVSKKQPPEIIQEFIAFENSRGRTANLGENYVKEWKDKLPTLRGDFRCHLIGHLQSNKAVDACSVFDCIQTVDSIKIIRKLDDARGSVAQKLPVMIQVNISNDDDKKGVKAGELEEISSALENSRNLELVGLMTITKIYEEPSDAVSDFRAIRVLRDKLQVKHGKKLALSMGMSDDFECAILEGATHVRVGTAIFGARKYL